MKKIAIIGTGLSALSLAHHLPTLDITFFEKSWRPGGRLSTRKQSDLKFDHGAHFLSPDHGVLGFTEALEKVQAIKKVEGLYTPNYYGGASKEIKSIIIGDNGIESIPINLHKSLRYPTNFSTKIEKIEREEKDYYLFSDKDKFGPFDMVFAGIPFEQGMTLLQDHIDFSQYPYPTFNSIWTVMLGFDKRLGTDLQFGYYLTKEISFFMNQNFKHEQFNQESWVFNMRSEWTNKYYDIEPYVLEDHVVNEVKRIFQSDAKATFKKSHRWKYANTKKSLRDLNGKTYISSVDHKLYLLGDWGEGPAMQDAWLAGKKLAKHIEEFSLKI